MSGHGFTVDLPTTWEGRIYRRTAPQVPFTPENRAPVTTGARATGSGATGAGAAQRSTSGWLGEQPGAVVHLANFPLPADRGDYGSGAVEVMGSADVFLALLEVGQECLGTALYSSVGLPRVRADRFDVNGLQRRIAGQAGAQYFFTEQSRPLCLYVVLGSYRNAARLSAEVNKVLDRIKVDAA